MTGGNNTQGRRILSRNEKRRKRTKVFFMFALILIAVLFLVFMYLKFFNIRKIELIGIDAPTIGIPEDDYEVHREFLLAGIPIIEGLCLGEPQTGNYTLYAPPIKLSDAEGAPCRALLIK